LGVQSPAAATPSTSLPAWANELVTAYESHAANQFILHGNVDDRLVVPAAKGKELGSLGDFLSRVLLPGFDVVLSYDLGNGIRVDKGGEIFSKWPTLKDLGGTLPHAPRPAIEALTTYFRYEANLRRLGHGSHSIGCVVKSAQLVAPESQGALSYDLSALASLMRDWSTDSLFVEHPLATFLIAENLVDLHRLLATNVRAIQVRIPLPSPTELAETLAVLAPKHPVALGDVADRWAELAGAFAGVSGTALESLLRTSEHRRRPIGADEFLKVKRELVERDSNGLVEFVESKRTLDDLHGLDAVKDWLRQDFALWKQNDLAAMPMGYLLCGPVGTGKTFTVECLAGEAGVPVVKLKNFRDKWIGSTEGNLEKIFRLLHALGRCFVFVDEADQALGRRDAQSGDSGVSGRVYSMMAEEMSNTKNRGKIVWILASSRPDLIEVDLKRPGRVDVKIPLFPTSTPEESLALVRALCARKGVPIDDAAAAALKHPAPPLMTPGAAETLAVKVYRLSRTRGLDAKAALDACLADYQNPVPREVLDFQIGLAVREASDIEFVPPAFRDEGNRA
jgi:hypothetical protein